MNKVRSGSINFFRPSSGHARATMWVIAILFSAWAVTVFGFQTLLWLTSTPTPEAGWHVFMRIWPAASTDAEVSPDDHRQLARVLLGVLGKNIVLQEADRRQLGEALTWTVVQVIPPGERHSFLHLLPADGADAPSRMLVSERAAAALHLQQDGFDHLLADLLPYALTTAASGTLTPDVRESLPGVMQRYLFHNRGPLTEATFMQFPFHYWFTAQGSLFIFVLLCLIYAIAVDWIHKRTGISDD